MRFLASLTEEGGVEVWKIKGKQENHAWDLAFNSVRDIFNNPDKENQFIISMNSNDEAGLSNTVLLFQYSRPQNLIMYWKSQLPFVKFLYCEQETTSYVLLINKNLEV